ncbi:hypothetical protein PIB30_073100 [Stylosanthes scabra]|uniref:Uncharacterized protein n=1 Tax=Stylosanthes scabra TaxID=79078 RepID=A0ABU6QNX5_9FABA|nr:hypothetical protein [Stylosanthes scabra]
MQENRHHFCAIALKELPIANRGSFLKRSRRLMAKDTLLIVYGDAFKVRLGVPLVGALIKRRLLLNRESEIKKFRRPASTTTLNTESLSSHTTPPPPNRNPQLSHTTTSHDDRPPSTATLGLHRPTAAATTFFTASLSLVLTLTPATTTIESQRASNAPSSRRRVPSRHRHCGAVPAKSSVAIFSHSDWFLTFRAFPLPQQLSSSLEGWSAHCSLATYWSKKLQKCDFNAYQASSRGGVSKIHLDKQNQRVLLKGKAVTVIEGSILV